MVSPGNPYYGIYRYHIGYQYTLLRDFDTKCRKSYDIHEHYEHLNVSYMMFNNQRNMT